MLIEYFFGKNVKILMLKQLKKVKCFKAEKRFFIFKTQTKFSDEFSSVFKSLLFILRRTFLVLLLQS